MSQALLRHYLTQHLFNTFADDFADTREVNFSIQQLNSINSAVGKILSPRRS